MIKPKMTSEMLHENTTPPCPHCGGPMCDSTLKLEDLVHGMPLPARINVQWDGYAHHGQALIVDCLECRKPSAVACDGVEIKLVALRTPADDTYLAERVPELAKDGSHEA